MGFSSYGVMTTLCAIVENVPTHDSSYCCGSLTMLPMSLRATIVPPVLFDLYLQVGI
jgi:hypothetical protein